MDRGKGFFHEARTAVIPRWGRNGEQHVGAAYQRTEQKIDLKACCRGWYASPVRYERFPRSTARPITPRRLQAADNALRRERERHPLFADEIAADQPTPAERLLEQEALQAAYWQRIRDHVAVTWRKARAILMSLPSEEQRGVRDRWNNTSCPGKAEYFADFIYQQTGRSASRE